DPFAVGDDAEAYVAAQMQRYDVPDEGLDRAGFIDGLVIPAHAQGVARLLIRDGFSIRLHGRGWNDIDLLADYADGPVGDRASVRAIIDRSAALVLAWPVKQAHP